MRRHSSVIRKKNIITFFYVRKRIRSALTSGCRGECDRGFGTQQGADAFTFTGYSQEYMPGVLYAQARENDVETGRFLSPDAMPGFIHYPSTLNPYLYCVNDPLNYMDPTGHILAWLAGGIVGAVANVAVKIGGDIVFSVASGEWKFSSWQSYVGAAAGG